MRTRDYCTTPKHIVAMCLAVIKCGIEMNNFAHVNNYVQKAEQTPDVAVRSRSPVWLAICENPCAPPGPKTITASTCQAESQRTSLHWASMNFAWYIRNLPSDPSWWPEWAMSGGSVSCRRMRQ